MASKKYRLKLDFDDYPLDEIEAIEKAAGMSVAEMAQQSFPAAAIAALIWYEERKTNPEFSLAQARKVKFGDVEFEEGEAENPTKAGS